MAGKAPDLVTKKSALQIRFYKTDSSYTSLNLGHAVAVVCSQLFSQKKSIKQNCNIEIELASCEEIEYLCNKLFEKLQEKVSYKNIDNKKHTDQKIRNLLKRINNFSKSELKILHSIIK